MVKELTLMAIQLADLSHVVITQLEVEDVDIFSHPFRVHTLRQGDNVLLHNPAENDLSNRLAVLFTDRFQYGIVENFVLALRKWCPGFWLDIFLRHES